MVFIFIFPFLSLGVRRIQHARTVIGGVLKVASYVELAGIIICVRKRVAFVKNLKVCGFILLYLDYNFEIIISSYQKVLSSLSMNKNYIDFTAFFSDLDSPLCGNSTS